MINGWKGFESILYLKKKQTKQTLYYLQSSLNVFDFNNGTWLVVHYYCISRMRKIICFLSISFETFEMMFRVLILKPFYWSENTSFWALYVISNTITLLHPRESHSHSTIHCGLLPYMSLILLIDFPFKQPIGSWSSLSFKHNEW